jgi:cytochrome P450 family 110
VVHERPDLYPEPRSFRPDRFLERTFSPFEHLPFGGGSRRCIGAAFGLYQMKMVLGALVSGYRVEQAQPGEVEPVLRNLTMGPKGGIPAIGSKRRYPARGDVTSRSTAP